MSTSDARATTRRVLTFLLLAVLCFALMPPMTAIAGSSVGSFEIDGNTTDSPAGEPIDWSSSPPHMVTFTDGTGNSDDTFGGSKENNPDGWSFVTNGAPSKADIVKGAIAWRELNGKIYAYVNFTRAASNGDTFANFEFNRLKQTFVNSIGQTVPKRQAGDLLVAFFVTNGGQKLGIKLGKWVGDYRSGSWNMTAGTQGSNFDAAVNADSQGRWDFAEAAIDLSAFGVELSCPGLGQGWIKTTSSDTFESAALQDHTDRKDVNLSNCATKNWEFTFTPVPLAGASVWAVYTVTGNVDPSRTLQLSPAAGPGGTVVFTASDGSVPPGTLAYHFEVHSGPAITSPLIWRSDSDLAKSGDQDGQETLAKGQTKTNTSSLAYSLTFGPNGVNFVNSPHIFTASVSGVGAVGGVTSPSKALPNVTVSFANLGSCGSLSTSGADTTSDGKASTTLTSATPCTTSVRAWIQGTFPGSTSGYDSGERTGTATKTFLDYDIIVSPASATNDVLDPHTFTVTLRRDTGSGPQGVPDQTLTLTLDTGGTDAHFTAINGSSISGSPTTTTCKTRTDNASTPTNEAGTCTATIVASKPGTVTLTAKYTTPSIGGEIRTISSNDGDKHYVDASISITPQTAVNEVGKAHVFTVTFTAYPDGAPGPVTFGPITTSVSPNPTSQSSTCGSPSGTGNTRTCTLTINSSTANVFTVNAAGSMTVDGTTVPRSTSARPGSAGTGPATKRYVDASVAISPRSAVNEVGHAHVFNVTVTGYPGGSGVTPSFDSITPSVSPTPTSMQSTCGSPSGTGNTRTCSVTINSSNAVQYTANVTAVVTMGGVRVTRSTAGNSGPGGSGPATKSYVSLAVTGSACPTSAPRGGLVHYEFEFTTAGGTLHQVTAVDTLPAQMQYLSASQIAGASPQRSTVNGHDVVSWSFASLAPGTYVGSIDVRINPAAPMPSSAVNVFTVDSDETVAHAYQSTTAITNEGAYAGGRAFGIKADLLGSELIPATPDSDVEGGGNAFGIADPFGGKTLLARVLHVSENDESTLDMSKATAIASASEVNLNVPGVLSLRASSVVGKAVSQATLSGSGYSTNGSAVQDLFINGVGYGVITEPTTFVVKAPSTGDVLAEIRVLESTTDEDLHGINGLHVIVPALGADIVVSHAEAEADYPLGLGCYAGDRPTVAARAFALDTVAPGAQPLNVAFVDIPAYGGSKSAALTDIELPNVYVGTASSSANGQTAGDPADAHASAAVADLKIGDAFTAELVKATSNSAPNASGNAEIAKLVIGGTDVCSELEMDSSCSPAPNTPLLVLTDSAGVPHTAVELNEQIAEGCGLTVNAVHIWVLGKGNPLDLPVGAEIIIASAHSAVNPADGECTAVPTTGAPTVIDVPPLPGAPSGPSSGDPIPTPEPAPIALPTDGPAPIESPAPIASLDPIPSTGTVDEVLAPILVLPLLKLL